MGDFSYGFLSVYSRMGRYSKVMILLFSLMAVFGSLSFAAPCPAPSACSGSATTPPTACPNGAAAGCVVVTSYACVSGASRCVNQTEAITLPLCGIYNTVHSVVFLLGIVLIILGGALYAGAHIMPSQSKGAVQGYGMGFIMGGIIGVIIAVLAPYIIGLVSGQAGSSILQTCQMTLT